MRGLGNYELRPKTCKYQVFPFVNARHDYLLGRMHSKLFLRLQLEFRVLLAPDVSTVSTFKYAFLYYMETEQFILIPLMASLAAPKHTCFPSLKKITSFQ